MMRFDKRSVDRIWKMIYSSGKLKQKNISKDIWDILCRIYYIADSKEPDYPGIWDRISRRINRDKRRIVRLKQLKQLTAVAVILITGIIILFHIDFSKNTLDVSVILTNSSELADVKLILANGKEVNLSDPTVHQIIENEQAVICKDSVKGELTYQSKTSNASDLEYNIIDVPQTAEYRLTLSDGTKVYLNSASCLKYPVVFSREERKVFLEGEGYFEVSEDRERPFRVIVRDMEVEALGTAFNVNAYQDHQNIQTTLVEGKVLISCNAGRIILTPGKQAIYGSDKIVVREVDYREYTAWKDGRFIFNKLPLEEIMEQLRRWYGIEVFFRKEECKRFTFTGMIDRNLPLEEIFRIFHMTTDTQFCVKGNTVIIN